MATGPHWNGQRGFWFVRWKDGDAWRKPKVADGPRGWRPGDPEPTLAKAPPEAFAAVHHYGAMEAAAADRRDGDLEAFVLAHADGYAKPLTRASVRTTAEQFVGFCAGLGVHAIAGIDRPLCRRWVADMAPRYGINTVKRKLTQMAAIWSSACRAGELDHNPFAGIEPRGKPVAKGRGSWTPAQFDRLVGDAPPIKPWLRDLLVFGVNTGLRIEALLRLEWRDVVEPETPDQRLGFVVVRPELDKAGTGYKVPLSRMARDLLDRKRNDPGRHPRIIITSSRGQEIANRSVTGTAIKRRCARVGLPIPTSANHHLRRTFGRWAHFGHLTGKPIPLYTVSRFLGHKNTRTTLIYLDLSEEDGAAFMVPD